MTHTQGSLNYVVEFCKHTGRCGKKDKTKIEVILETLACAPLLCHARTHASHYADTAEQTTQSPGDVFVRRLRPTGGLKSPHTLPGTSLVFQSSPHDRAKHKRDICAVGSADARAFLELAVGPRPSGFCSCGGNGGGRIRFQRRRGTGSSAATSNNRKSPLPPQ